MSSSFPDHLRDPLRTFDTPIYSMLSSLPLATHLSPSRDLSKTPAQPVKVDVLLPSDSLQVFTKDFRRVEFHHFPLGSVSDPPSATPVKNVTRNPGTIGLISSPRGQMHLVTNCL